VAGRLARVVLPLLCADRDIESVTGIDRAEPAFRDGRFTPLVADVADPRAHAPLRGADALVHLAFVLPRGRATMQHAMRANVAATQALLSAAAAAGVRAIVHMSSAAVYGQGTELTEDARLAPLPRFRYAQQKAQVEAWIARELPRATVLRPTIILGPNAQPLLHRLAATPFYVKLPDPQPRLQVVHEGDVAQAVVLALKRGASGAFNLAAASSFSVREFVLARRPHARALPLPLARLALEVAWRVTGWGGEPGWFDGIAASLTLDCNRARVTLGWQPAHEDWRQIVRAPPTRR
jgi:nucleoside-diphosphate-sugar epimerase